jgi:FMN phosphatase YigB (HAD superfamily)/glycosyltransferase involved in cell wall biosynthesis
MRVAIVHYHLTPGGVTRVIESASQALTSAGVRHVVLTGDDVTGLGYLPAPGKLTAAELLTSLRSAASQALGAPPDIWHFHNHSLGKNVLLPQVIARLAADGERIVLQIHDLAEAGRPANYPLIADHLTLYPFSPRIRYAFLNSRDLHTFTGAGLPTGNATLLPNPIPLPSASLRDLGASAVNSSAPTILFAPIRGIRRKNLGELVFLSALAPPDTWFATSRAPLNPDTLPIHENWRKFATRHRLPIEFGVTGRLAPAAGAGSTFDSWVGHATHFVTTSVAEGFGLPFLEAIAHGKPLLGRNLPHLTAEHTRHGIRTGHLYDRLLIPVSWIDLTLLRDELTVDIERTYRAYRRPLSPEIIDSTLARLTHGDWLDFGNLPEPLQQGIIERFLQDPAHRSVPRVEADGTTRPAAEWLAAAIADRTPTATPDQLGPYSTENYQEALTSLYQNLSSQAAPPVSHVSPERILSAHLTPGSFHFLLSALRPAPVLPKACRAVIFDIYGTLLIAPPGGVRPDPFVDPVLRDILRSFDHDPPASPSSELHAAVLRHHAAAGVGYPEIDLRVLWREILDLSQGTDTTALVEALEAAWHPARPMPGAEQAIGTLARSGLSLGLLSNAQCNTLATLGGISDLFAPELTILSYQHGLAKPSPALFQILTDRLAGHGVSPGETLIVGNDPLHDILPAAAAGFQTALYNGHPDSHRPGECAPDLIFTKWPELIAFIRRTGPDPSSRGFWRGNLSL